MHLLSPAFLLDAGVIDLNSGDDSAGSEPMKSYPPYMVTMISSYFIIITLLICRQNVIHHLMDNIVFLIVMEIHVKVILT